MIPKATLFFSLVSFGCLTSIVEAQPPRFRLAVYDFAANGAGIDADFTTTISDLVRLELAREQRFTVLERQDMARLYLDRTAAQKMPTVYDPDTAVTVGRVLEANYVVLGEVRSVDGRRFLLMRVVQVSTSAIAAVATEPLTSNLPSFVKAIVGQIVSQIFPGIDFGILEIDVTPPTSRISISGEAVDRTPPARLSLRPGIYSIAVLPPDVTYKPAALTAEIKSGVTTTQSIALERRRTVAHVAPALSKVLLYVDARFVDEVSGGDDVQVDAGSHSIMFITRDGSVFSASRYFDPDTSVDIPWVPTQSELSEAGKTRLINQVHLNRRIVGAAGGDAAVFVATDDAAVSAFAHDSLSRLWRHSSSLGLDHLFGGSRAIALAVHRDDSSRDGPATYFSIVRIHPDTGGTIWKSGDTSAPLRCASHGSDVTAFAFDGGRFAALSNNESLEGSIDTRPGDLPLDWRTCAVSNATLSLVDSSRRIIYNFELSQHGKQNWHRELEDTIRQYASCGSAIVAVTDTRHLVALNVSDGTLKWHRTLENDADFVRCYRSDQIVVVSKSGDYVQITVDSGEMMTRRLLWSMPQIITECQLDQSGRLLVVLNDFRVVLYDYQLDMPIWSFDLRERLVKLVVTRGRVIILCEGGWIHELGDERRAEITGHLDLTTTGELIGIPWEPSEVVSVGAAFAVQHHLTQGAVASTPTRIVSAGSVSSAAGKGFLLQPITRDTHVSPGDLLVPDGTVHLPDMPNDAAVWIDDQFIGTGVSVIEGLRAGDHSIVAYERGKQLFTQHVSIHSGTDVVVKSMFTALDESVAFVVSDPPGSALYVDARFIGQTPVTVYGLSRGQVIEIRLTKFGYTSLADRVVVDVPHVSRHYKLRYASMEGHLFIGFGNRGLSYLEGWAANDISSDGVHGQPLSTTSSMFVDAGFDYAAGKKAIFGGFYGSAEAPSGSLGVGLFASNRCVCGEVRLGFSAVIQGASTSSQAPGYGEGGTRSDLPLEYWSHPISGVFVDNGDVRTYVEPQVRWQFLEGLLGRAAYGMLIAGGQLSGTVLTEDARFHLVKDASRSYSFLPQRGHYVSLSLSSRLRLEHLLPSRAARYVAAKIEYRNNVVDFGSIVERGSTVRVGLGVAIVP